VEDEDVSGLVVDRGPAALMVAEHPRLPGRPEMTSRTDGQAAQPDGYLRQRHPGREHVLNAGRGVVLMDVAASCHAGRPFGVDRAQDFHRIGERLRPRIARIRRRSSVR